MDKHNHSRMSLPPVLLAETFVNNSVCVKHDIIHNLLNETFQMTVRQQIYDEGGEN